MKSKTSNQEWKKLIDEYKHSSLSILKFSKAKNINPSTFAYWVRKFKDPKRKTVNLVKIKSPIISSEKLKIIWKDISLELPESISVEKIAELITAIKEVC